MLNTLLSSLNNHNIEISVHLVSGENYVGLCEKTTNPNVVLIKTDHGDVRLQVWTIKRFKILRINIDRNVDVHI
ncbi:MULTISPECIES: hypothetical protein [unclassified Paenibacillus]|uniref:hypothetical protein n=1 Tax=unclassified Paenibacillus TaxID=185978 RepID=UPI0009A8FA56|nr:MULTISPECIES: hypothetical protein [unclassified Paenibacillus]SLK21034.1 hypothetical protein SAMN06272722_11777 [Paenibacillus sp. RU5A]SOC76433.1 hypothetical protein SAMN05880581_11777 [Paenibacillus sp. RU26A]SOC77902.1 hypothetical protein SAMN05880586_1174 [Paenibacillus sp. RU5M]